MSDFIEEKYFQKMNNLNFKLLCEIDRICKKYGIKYYLAYGTLLGAIRHKDLIPWDDDMDLIITDKELKKFISHADELSDEFMLVKPTDYGEDVYFDSIVRVNLKNTRICPGLKVYCTESLPISTRMDVHLRSRGIMRRLSISDESCLVGPQQCKLTWRLVDHKIRFANFMPLCGTGHWTLCVDLLKSLATK